MEYKVSNHQLSFRYVSIIENFDMPVIAFINGNEEWIFPTAKWKTKKFAKEVKSVKIKEDFYVETVQVSN